MTIKSHNQANSQGSVHFNMTPLIDVVFLLIIFFMLVCQFIVQENYKLIVPDDCSNAIIPENFDRNAITVSVFRNEKKGAGPTDVLYAVRSKVFDPAAEQYRDKPDKLLKDVTETIIQQAEQKADPLIYLRADYNMNYADVQQAMIALSRAGITKIQLAAFRNPQDRLK